MHNTPVPDRFIDTVIGGGCTWVDVSLEYRTGDGLLRLIDLVLG